MDPIVMVDWLPVEMRPTHDAVDPAGNLQPLEQRIDTAARGRSIPAAQIDLPARHVFFRYQATKEVNHRDAHAIGTGEGLDEGVSATTHTAASQNCRNHPSFDLSHGIHPFSYLA